MESKQQAKHWHIKWFIIVILSVVSLQLFVSFQAFKLQKETIDVVSPDVYTNLLKPYSIALKNKEFEKAYTEFTTNNYKEKHSYEDFLQAQEDNIKHFGNIDSIGLTSGIFVFMKDLERKWVYRGTANYYTDKLIMQFAIDVVKDTTNNVYKISRTYPSQVTIRASAPMIF